ncbi:MAG: class I SAM-dependent methyltransferase [Tannerellaceae bacterium]|nr:class I SAM-dependent methyltransferase [Tannerellaceae bacterium]
MMEVENSEIKEFYDSNIDYWEKYARKEVRKEYLELLDLRNFYIHTKAPLRILDVGCGTGYDEVLISDLLSPGEFEGAGVDFCEKAIKYAVVNNKADKISSSWKFIFKDIFQIDPVYIREQLSAGQLFDVIICSMVVMHYENLDGIFKLFSRFMADNGKLLIVTNNPYLISQEYNVPYKTSGEYTHEFRTGLEGKRLRVTKYLHTLPAYIEAAKKSSLWLERYKEILSYNQDTYLYNDMNNNELNFPNFISLLFRK